MLRKSPVFPSFSVDDPDKARAFYSQVLGLEVRDVPGMPGLLEIPVAGTSPVMIYPKADHVPATYTVLNFPVEDVEETVDALARAGVAFEHYDREEYRTDAKGISRDGDMAMAWFKDPAGNILSVLTAKHAPQGEDLVLAGSDDSVVD